MCGLQVVTVNDYLARRDSEWVGQVPRFLGLQVRACHLYVCLQGSWRMNMV